MSVTRRRIFRERAIQQYVQRREKDVLPRFVSPPIFLFLWSLLGLCMAAGWLAWSIQLPIYTPGIGMMTEGGQDGRSTAILFAAANQLQAVRPGQSAQVSLGSDGSSFKSTITTVSSKPLSPAEARKQYKLDGTLALMVTQPSVVIVVLFDANFSTLPYEGSIVHAEIQVGSQRVLSTVPVLGQMLGE